MRLDAVIASIFHMATRRHRKFVPRHHTELEFEPRQSSFQVRGFGATSVGEGQYRERGVGDTNY